MNIKKMKIIHVTNEINYKNFSIYSFIIFLIQQHKNNSLVFIENLKSKLLLNKNIKVFKLRGGWCCFFNLRNKILEENSSRTIFHIHGLWSPIQLYSLIILAYFNIPTVIHSHGMLLKPALKSSGFSKFIIKYLFVFFFKFFLIDKKIVFIAITHEEKYSIKSYFPNTQVYLVPNTIPFNKEYIINKFKFSSKKNFVFFGRIHPLKNIELIIDEFLKAKLPINCLLKIYGIKDDYNYFLQLRNKIKNYRNIKIYNPVFGKKKQKIMSSAWVNILLSKSEVLSFSLLESGFLGLPTLVGKNFELPKNDNFTIKNKENDSDIYKTFKQISEWSLDYRKNLYHKLSNFYLNYKKNYDYLCTLRIDNIYKATLLKKNILKSSTDFIIATLTYSFNFFLPAFLTVFFYLMGNPVISAEIGLYSGLVIAITQLFSANARSIVISRNNSDLLLIHIVYRLFFTIIFLTLIHIFLFSFVDIKYFTFINLLSILIFLQWNFELILIRFELARNKIAQILVLLFYSILMCVLILFIIFSKEEIINLVFLIFIIIFCIIIFANLYENLKKNTNLLFKSITRYNSLNYFNFLYPFLSSLFIAGSGLFWKYFIYNNFEKKISGLFFAGFAIGSFFGTFFNLILGPAYISNKVKINNVIKNIIILFFILILVINVLIYLNLEKEIINQFLNYFISDYLFFEVTLHSLLGSFFMTYSMYLRQKTIFISNIKNNIFFIDIIYSFFIIILLPLLYYFFHIEGVSNLFLLSSIFAIFFYKILVKKL